MHEPAYFAWHLAAHGESPCVRDQQTELTYAGFAAAVDDCAVLLFASGVRRGHVVAILLPNCVELLVAIMASWRLGAIATPLNPEFGPAEAEHQLTDSGARILITDRPDTATRTCLVLTVDDIRAHPERREPSGWSAHFTYDPSADDSALLIYTSGTTGKPKGVELTHGNLQFMASSMVGLLSLTETDHCLLVLPLFHVNAICVSFLSPILAGGQLSITDRFSPRYFAEDVETLKPTYFSAVPMIYALLRLNPDNLRPGKLTSLRFAVSGAAPISQELLLDVEELLGVPVIEGYGLTEGTCAATCNPPTGVRKPGTVGPAIPGQTVAISSTHGPTTDPGVVGEVLIAGPNVMRGYYNLPTETASAITDNWLLTGDIGHLDADGYLTIIDRIKDMIIRGGENIYPKEIENTLTTHPHVVEAAVVGRKDAFAGELPVAYVVTLPNSDISGSQLVDFLSERLVRAKVPISVHIINAMPRNAVGKIDKIALRERTSSP